MSHPLWVRGLKSVISVMPSAIFDASASHPLWVRGLKYGRLSDIYQYIHVAPFMGAWIEMPKQGSRVTILFVAPFMGAWIEIYKLRLTLDIPQRRTLYGCVD